MGTKISLSNKSYRRAKKILAEQVKNFPEIEGICKTLRIDEIRKILKLSK
jgi:hypothetical protein